MWDTASHTTLPRRLQRLALDAFDIWTCPSLRNFLDTPLHPGILAQALNRQTYRKTDGVQHALGPTVGRAGMK